MLLNEETKLTGFLLIELFWKHSSYRSRALSSMAAIPALKSVYCNSMAKGDASISTSDDTSY